MSDFLFNVFNDLLGCEQISAQFSRSEPIWCDYDNPEHFDCMWRSLDGMSLSGINQVFIVWRQTPVDSTLEPINTSKHVSPLHWAVCARHNYPHMQTCILDLNPITHRNQYIYENFLNTEKVRCTWLNVLQSTDLFGNGSTNRGSLTDVNPVTKEDFKTRIFPKITQRRGMIEPSYFFDCIRNELTSPHDAENRHSISNIIGPMILRRECKPPIKTSEVTFIKDGKKTDFPSPVQSIVSHTLALNSILRIVGLLFAEIPENNLAVSPSKKLPGWLEFDLQCRLAGLNPEEVRVTLVDDQWQHGWLDWIKDGLGASSVTLQVSPDPDFLLKLLQNTSSEYRQFNLAFNFDRKEQWLKKQDVLLLDLRLFSSNPAAERNFLTALEVILIARSTDEKTIDDEQHICDDLAVVRRRLQGFDESPKELSGVEHARYITILPRMLAQLDFSIPIVIFSSTGQRDVVELLKNFPNIITTFSKPRHFQGANEEAVLYAEECLRQSIIQALKILQGRKLVQRIKLHPLDVLEKTRKRCSGHTHFELYFDESGDANSPFFRCAALLVGYAGGDGDNYSSDAWAVHESMGEQGLKWYFEENASNLPKALNDTPNGRYDADTQWLTRVAKPLADVLEARPIIPFVISRSPKSHNPPVDFLDLIHPDALDNALHDLLLLLLEIVLAEVLPNIVSNMENITINIYGATREKRVPLKAKMRDKAEKEGENLWKRLINKFGFDKNDLRDERLKIEHDYRGYHFFYRSLRGSSILPFLVNALRARKNSGGVHKAIRSALNVILSEKRRPDAAVRHQHYICDRLAHICSVPDVLENSPHFNTIDLRVMRDWTPFIDSGIGFLGRNNNALSDLIDCGRYLDSNEIGNAFFMGSAVLLTDGIFSEALASRLKKSIPMITVASFRELCSLLSENYPHSEGSVIQSERFIEAEKLERTDSKTKINIQQKGPTKRKGVDETKVKGDKNPNLPRLGLMIQKIQVNQLDISIREQIDSILKGRFSIQYQIKVRHSKADNTPYAIIRFKDEISAMKALDELNGEIQLFGFSYKLIPTL